jgi:hypothetical protein
MRLATGQSLGLFVSSLGSLLKKEQFFVGSISGCTHLLRRSKPSLSFVGYLQRVAWLLCQMNPHTCLSATALLRDKTHRTTAQNRTAVLKYDFWYGHLQNTRLTISRVFITDEK